MRRAEKILLWTGISLGALVTLAGLLTLLAPWLINMEMVRENIRHQFQANLHARMQFQRIDLAAAAGRRCL